MGPLSTLAPLGRRGGSAGGAEAAGGACGVARLDVDADDVVFIAVVVIVVSVLVLVVVTEDSLGAIFDFRELAREASLDFFGVTCSWGIGSFEVG